MYDTEYCSVTYLEDLDAVLCRWKKFCRAEDYRAPLRHGLELLREHNVSTWITDTTDGFENEPEDTQWLLEIFLPEVVSGPCKNVTFIIDDASPLKEEIAQQAEALSHYFNVWQIDTLENAAENKHQKGAQKA